MTKEEARAYFIDNNERIISVAKDENIYNYKTQQVEDVFMRRTFEANELAIKALEQDPQETVTEFADRCRECGKMKRCRDCKYFEYNSVAKVDGIPLIVAHEICSKWGNGCKTSEDGYCFLFEPKEEGIKHG